MAVQDVCGIHVRTGRARSLSGKSKTDGFSALTTVNFLQRNADVLGSLCPPKLHRIRCLAQIFLAQ